LSQDRAIIEKRYIQGDPIKTYILKYRVFLILELQSNGFF